MHSPGQFPFLLKLLIAAAVVAVGIVAYREISRRTPLFVQPATPGEPLPADLAADTLARVREIIAVHTASLPEVVTPAMPLSDLGVDPLTRVEIADALETAYRIKLSTDELSAATTVDDLVRLVMDKRAAGE